MWLSWCPFDFIVNAEKKRSLICFACICLVCVCRWVEQTKTTNRDFVVKSLSNIPIENCWFDDLNWMNDKITRTPKVNIFFYWILKGSLKCYPEKIFCERKIIKYTRCFKRCRYGCEWIRFGRFDRIMWNNNGVGMSVAEMKTIL